MTSRQRDAEAADMARETARKAPAALFGMCVECGAIVDEGKPHADDCPDKPPFPKCCTCCARVLSQEEWNGLTLVGHHEDEVERLELRLCTCGTSLAIQVPR